MEIDSYEKKDEKKYYAMVFPILNNNEPANIKLYELPSFTSKTKIMKKINFLRVNLRKNTF